MKERINKQFDSQIKRELYKFKKVSDCPSYWNKQLFNLTYNFSLDDWRYLRDEKYWEVMDRTPNRIAQIQHTIKTISDSF